MFTILPNLSLFKHLVITNKKSKSKWNFCSKIIFIANKNKIKAIVHKNTDKT